MRTLKNHVLIYDRDCPLCNLYTTAFIKSGMLDSCGRENYCTLQSTSYPNMDRARSKDEIALVNKETGEVMYGVNSLFTILSHSFPFLKILFQRRLFHFLMSKFYAFVSYNRKVIAPAKEFEAPCSCTPSFNIKYRLLYILLSWIFTSTILTIYSTHLISIISPTNFLREWIVCGGQIIFQSITVFFLKKNRLLHYLGNMMTVSNIGALLLIPALFSTISQPLFYLIWFGAVVTFMLYEHNRRTQILSISFWASVSWVIYRAIVLLIIL